ncbi:MAG: DUF6471 domain-containing protein [Xanthobacteraceae bacterium]
MDASGNPGYACLRSSRAQRYSAAFLKHKLPEAEITCVELAKRLEKHGFKETEASVTNKLKRGTLPDTFFLAVLAALELDCVALEKI